MNAPTEVAPSPSFLGELLRRRYRYRQAVGIAFAALIVALGTPTHALVLAGAAFAALGMAVRLWASGHVKKDTELATTGPYAHVRHPLYVGNHLIAIGLCLASGLWWSFVVWLALALFFYPAAIRREDARLSTRFPEQWKAWRAETHALFWSWTPYRPAGGGAAETGTWSFRQSLVQNGEPIYVAIIVFALAYLWAQVPQAL